MSLMQTISLVGSLVLGLKLTQTTAQVLNLRFILFDVSAYLFQALLGLLQVPLLALP